ncbi:hypothetical protein H0H93_012659 [Arthromyces matolae]|nr:hypothetical protein H0H93_012659 [Arthromyces matolae]
MVNPPATNSPKETYAQVIASPKPRVSTTMLSRSATIKVKSDVTKTSNGGKTSADNRNETETSASSKATVATQPSPDEGNSKDKPNTYNDVETAVKNTLVDYASEMSPPSSNKPIDQPEVTITPPNGSPNRYLNTDLPALPSPKSRKSHRKDKKDAKKLSPPKPDELKSPGVVENKPETDVTLPATSKVSSNDPANEEDDQLTPKAVATGDRTTLEPQTPLMKGTSTNANLTTPSPPRIPSKAKGKGKEVPQTLDFPHTLLLAQPSSNENPALKRKFEDTPTKYKPPVRTAEFQTPKRQPYANEEPVAYAGNTVDAFDHPSTRGPVYSDDPEPGVLPEPAYFMETPPFTRYPQDEPLKKLATLLSNKDTFNGNDFDLRKEAMRLQELAKDAGTRLYAHNINSDDMLVDNLTGPANPGTQQSITNASTDDQESALAPSPTPLPRQRRPILPSLSRPHSSQGIPVRHLFTREYQSQYTRSLDTRSPEGSVISNEYNQYASEASYDSGNISPLPSGEFPGVFQEDFVMRDDSPAPPYQGEANRDQSPRDHAHHPDPQPPQVPAGTAGNNDPLRVWTPTDKQGEETNIRNITITAKPQSGWPEIFVKYLPLHDLDDKSLATVERASAPGTCWIAMMKCSQAKMAKLSTIDGIKRTLADLVTLQPGQSIGVSILNTKSVPSSYNSRFPPPHFALINGLNADQKEYLVNKFAVIHNDDISFLVYPMEVNENRYIGLIAGMYYKKEDIETVTNLVRQTTLSHGELDTIMASGNANHTHAAFRHLVNNITVTFTSIGDETDTNYIRGWNVSLPRHSMNNDTIKEFNKAMRRIQFTILGFGEGTFMPKETTPLCDGCKSLGHEWQDCAYPKIVGWRGPKPSAKKPASTNSQNQYTWIDADDDESRPIPNRPSGSNHRGRAAPRRGGHQRGRGNARGNGRGSRRF